MLDSQEDNPELILENSLIPCGVQTLSYPLKVSLLENSTQCKKLSSKIKVKALYLKGFILLLCSFP